MRISRLILLVGVIVIIFGTIFHLQGQGHIGPESSFMYTNPEWITNGVIILVLGLLILVTGGILSRANQ